MVWPSLDLWTLRIKEQTWAQTLLVMDRHRGMNRQYSLKARVSSSHFHLWVKMSKDYCKFSQHLLKMETLWGGEDHSCKERKFQGFLPSASRGIVLRCNPGHKLVFTVCRSHFKETLQRAKGTGYGTPFTARDWVKVDGMTSMSLGLWERTAAGHERSTWALFAVQEHCTPCLQRVSSTVSYCMMSFCLFASFWEEL